MKTRLVLAPLLIAAVAALSACGGSKSVPSDAVALVGSTPITKAQFNALMAQAQAQAKAAGQPVQAIGSPGYAQLQDKVVQYLVQVSELEQQAPKEGVSVTPKDVNAYLQSVAALHYGGSQKKLDAAIAASGLTVAQAKQQVEVQLLAQKIKNKVTDAVKVTTAEEQQYYNANKAAYHENTSRKVRHILVSSRSLALQLEQKLKNGANFAQLAKKYSKDSGTAAQGGDYTAVQGQDVPSFDKAAFSLKVNQISAPVHSQFGWHIIQALGPIVPAHVQPFSAVSSTIQQTLLSQKQNAAWGAWLTTLANDFKGKVEYAAGYAPATTTSTVPTVPATTG